MEDVLEVYEKSDDELNPLICIDEKPIQLLADVRPLIEKSDLPSH